MKKNNKNKKGFTLLEIILSIAIFSIMFVGFLTLFTTSFFQILETGNIGKDVYAAQSDIETSEFASSTEKEIEMVFDGYHIRVDGNVATTTAGDNNVELKVFIPDEGE